MKLLIAFAALLVSTTLLAPTLVQAAPAVAAAAQA